VSTTGSIITIFIININTIEVLILDDINKVCGDLVLAPEAVIPTVVGISGPMPSHTSSTKTKNDLFPLGTPTVYQRLVVRIIADGNCALNVTMSVAVVLSWSPGVGNSKGNHNVGIVFNLVSCGARLPISCVGNETRVIARDSGTSSRRGWRWRWSRWGGTARAVVA